MRDKRSDNTEEWTLMYRMGLTQQKISDLCGVPVGLVRRSIAWNKGLDASLQVQHEENAPEEATIRWSRRCEELTEFVAARHRLPSTKGMDRVERSLGRWLATQRSTAEKLNSVQIKRLDDAGNWRQTPRAESDDARWWRTLEECGCYLGTTSRLPSWRTYKTETERRLGTWLHAQRQKCRSGKLAVERRRALDECLPRWNTWNEPTGSGSEFEINQK